MNATSHICSNLKIQVKLPCAAELDRQQQVEFQQIECLGAVSDTWWRPQLSAVGRNHIKSAPHLQDVSNQNDLLGLNIMKTSRNLSKCHKYPCAKGQLIQKHGWHTCLSVGVAPNFVIIKVQYFLHHGSHGYSVLD